MRYAAHLYVLPPTKTTPTKFLVFKLTEIDAIIDFSASVEVVYGAAPGAKTWELLSIALPISSSDVLMTDHVTERTGRILVSLAKIYDLIKKGPITFLGEIERSWGKHVVYIESDKKWVDVNKVKDRGAFWRPIDKLLCHHSVDAKDEEAGRVKLARTLAEELVNAKTDKKVKKAIAEWMGNDQPIELVGGDAPQFVTTGDIALDQAK